MNGKIHKAELDSHRLDEAYLRWESVRHNGVPLSNLHSRNTITCKTGLEGYFVGKVKTSDGLTLELLKVGEEIWSSIRKLHRRNPQKIIELKKTILSDEYFTIAAVAEWCDILGAQLARLRTNLNNNPAGVEFHLSTREAVVGLPRIEYTLSIAGQIGQVYKVPQDTKSSVVTFSGSTDEQKLYWATVRNLGKFGHPLVRTAVSELYTLSGATQNYNMGSRRLKRRI